MAINQKYLVEKRNELNEMRGKGMNLQELRFLSIYLSRINPRECENTRIVRFSLVEFMKIMELKRENIVYFKNITRDLLQKVVTLPTEKGGYTQFQLFKKCILDRNDEGDWYIDINAHDDALPLMFDFKREYFKYELWNVLSLKSSNQIRMYEVLKQYENIGFRVMSVQELRELLGIMPSEYSRWTHFRERVLDSCQKALAEHTDISYKYEPYGKKGVGGKILQLKFTIIKNENYVDRLNLKEFLGENLSNNITIEGEIVSDLENDGAPAAILQEEVINDAEIKFIENISSDELKPEENAPESEKVDSKQEEGAVENPAPASSELKADLVYSTLKETFWQRFKKKFKKKFRSNEGDS
jgi:plasmid replication initiation protein